MTSDIQELNHHVNYQHILLMAEIHQLIQLIGTLQYPIILQGLIHPGWLALGFQHVSAINPEARVPNRCNGTFHDQFLRCHDRKGLKKKR